MCYFTFTADHEEPCCAWCDFQDTCSGAGVHCGPKYGWRLYKRTINIKDATPLEQKTIDLVIEYLDEQIKKKES